MLENEKRILHDNHERRMRELNDAFAALRSTRREIDDINKIQETEIDDINRQIDEINAELDDLLRHI